MQIFYSETTNQSYICTYFHQPLPTAKLSGVGLGWGVLLDSACPAACLCMCPGFLAGQYFLKCLCICNQNIAWWRIIIFFFLPSFFLNAKCHIWRAVNETFTCDWMDVLCFCPDATFVVDWARISQPHQRIAVAWLPGGSKRKTVSMTTSCTLCGSLQLSWLEVVAFWQSGLPSSFGGWGFHPCWGVVNFHLQYRIPISKLVVRGFSSGSLTCFPSLS